MTSDLFIDLPCRTISLPLELAKPQSLDLLQLPSHHRAKGGLVENKRTFPAWWEFDVALNGWAECKILGLSLGHRLFMDHHPVVAPPVLEQGHRLIDLDGRANSHMENH